MKTRITAIILAVALLALSGCSSIPADQQKTVAKLAVQYAVLKVADKNPVKAARVAAIAKEVQAIAGGEGANTVDLLLAIARTKVARLKLDAADQVLASALIDMVGQELKARLGTGVLTSDKLLIVGEVAGWIVEASALVPATEKAGP